MKFKMSISESIEEDKKPIDVTAIKEILSKLTKKELELIVSLKEGADIISHQLAGEIMGIYDNNPGLLMITKVQGKYSVKEKLPYFGCKAKEKVVQLINEMGRVDYTRQYYCATQDVHKEDEQ